MIVGVDHVALSCEGIQAAVQAVDAAGYRAKFVVIGLRNDEQKKPFLRSYTPAHSIAYCAGKGGLAIELTQHARALADTTGSPYHVLFAGALPEVSPIQGDGNPFAGVWPAALGGATTHSGRWSPLNIPCSYIDSGSSPGIRAIGILVRDLDRSEEFWRGGIGCREVSRGRFLDGRRWEHLAVRSPAATLAAEVLLAETASTPTRPYLDDPGFTCLAMVSTRLAADTERLRDAGASEVSDLFSLAAGDKEFAIALLRDPDGYPVELIQFGKR